MAPGTGLPEFMIREFYDDVALKSNDELKDIVINRNLYGGKMITAARKELEKRGISLTVSEKKQQEAIKKARVNEAKKNNKK